MIYLQINEDATITYRHYKPFDSVHGLGKTEEELLTTGILVEDVPTSDTSITDKQAILKYDSVNQKLYYEYQDVPKNPMDVKLKEVEDRMDSAILEMTTLMMMMGGLPNV